LFFENMVSDAGRKHMKNTVSGIGKLCAKTVEALTLACKAGASIVGACRLAASDCGLVEAPFVEYKGKQVRVRLSGIERSKVSKTWDDVLLPAMKDWRESLPDGSKAGASVVSATLSRLKKDYGLGNAKAAAGSSVRLSADMRPTAAVAAIKAALAECGLDAAVSVSLIEKK
jgi:hypothetical protein